MKHGKKYQDSIKLIEKQKLYDPREGIETVLSTAKAKFDETIEASIRLGVDPRHADQQVRGAVVLGQLGNLLGVGARLRKPRPPAPILWATMIW